MDKPDAFVNMVIGDMLVDEKFDELFLFELLLLLLLFMLLLPQMLLYDAAETAISDEDDEDECDKGTL